MSLELVFAASGLTASFWGRADSQTSWGRLDGASLSVSTWGVEVAADRTFAANSELTGSRSTVLPAIFVLITCVFLQW